MVLPHDKTLDCQPVPSTPSLELLGEGFLVMTETLTATHIQEGEHNPRVTPGTHSLLVDSKLIKKTAQMSLLHPGIKPATSWV